MDAVLQLLSLENLILCLAIVAIVWAHRKSFELFSVHVLKRDLHKSDWWTELIIPLTPLVVGASIVMIPGLPVPELFSASLGAKAVFGTGLGLISGLLYRLVKKNLLVKLGKEEEKTPYLDE